jgi:hypothetical protein
MGKELNVKPKGSKEATSKPKKSVGIIKRYKTKIAKLESELAEARRPKKTKTLKTKSKKEGFDYAEKAFMKVNDVNADEYELVQQIMGDTGKTLEEVLDSKYFRAEQKESREHKASEEAVPEGGSRSGKSSVKDSVGYWLDKGEMPPIGQTELRRAYVNARAKQDSEGSKFTEQPVVKA